MASSRLCNKTLSQKPKEILSQKTKPKTNNNNKKVEMKQNVTPEC
jgi:hypothetical protein